MKLVTKSDIYWVDPKVCSRFSVTPDKKKPNEVLSQPKRFMHIYMCTAIYIYGTQANTVVIGIDYVYMYIHI